MELLRPDQQRAATLTLAEAFANDPLLEIVAPDPGRRAKVRPAFMAVPMAFGMRYGRVCAKDDASAVAIWLHPGSGPISVGRTAGRRPMLVSWPPLRSIIGLSSCSTVLAIGG